MRRNKRIKIIIWMTIILLIIFCGSKVVQANSDIIVLLDPGHGGYDSGATSGSLLEKDVTWKITTRVKQILDNTSGITGVLSRGENDCPEIYQRGNMAKNIRS